MFVLIGNARNSGSTLLADLIDSHPQAICGPELELFSNPYLYEKVGKVDLSLPFPTFCLDQTRIGTYTERLKNYELDYNEFYEAWNSSSDILDFINWFVSHNRKVRKKKEALVFEKSPHNTNTIGRFLNKSDKHFFVHIVRNPVCNLEGILRRAPTFSTYFAASLWHLEEAKFFSWRDHPRVYVIKYEDLLQDPFATVCKLVHDIGGRNVRPCDLEEAYNDNIYRKNLNYRHSNWSVPDFGKINSNIKPPNERAKRIFSGSLMRQINKDYCRIHNLTQVSVKDVIDYYGYTTSVDAMIRDVPPYTPCTFEWIKSSFQLINKWKFDNRHDLASVKNINAYLFPYYYRRNR